MHGDTSGALPWPSNPRTKKSIKLFTIESVTFRKT